MVDFSFDLIYHHTSADLASRAPLTNLNQRLNASDYVTIKPNGGFNVTFALNLPKQGLYTFTIYAAATTTGGRNDLQSSNNGHTELPAVFTYLLRYTWAVFLSLSLFFVLFIRRSLINGRVVAFLSLSLWTFCCFLGTGKAWTRLCFIFFSLSIKPFRKFQVLCVRVCILVTIEKCSFVALLCWRFFLIYLYLSFSPSLYFSLSPLTLFFLSLCTWIGLVDQRTIVHLFVSSSSPSLSVVFFPFDDNNIAICTIE